jgi:predicted nucleic acid-binding protein
MAIRNLLTNTLQMKDILIYLDTCSIQRPLDDRSQPRIYMEAEAILTILRLVEAEELQLLSSDVLNFEVSRIVNTNRKAEAQTLLKLANTVASVKSSTKALSEQIIATGIKPFDALHAAVAIENGACYFCTCDDKLLKKLKLLSISEQTKFVSPLELVIEVTP